MKSGSSSACFFKSQSSVPVQGIDENSIDQKLRELLFNLYRASSLETAREVDAALNLMLNYDLYAQNKNKTFAMLISRNIADSYLVECLTRIKFRIDALCTGYPLIPIEERTTPPQYGVFYFRMMEKGLEYEIDISDLDARKGIITWEKLPLPESARVLKKSESLESLLLQVKQILNRYEDELLLAVLEHAIKLGHVTSRNIEFKRGNNIYDYLHSQDIYTEMLKAEEKFLARLDEIIIEAQKATASFPSLEQYEYEFDVLNQDLFKTNFKTLLSKGNNYSATMRKLAELREKWQKLMCHKDHSNSNYQEKHRAFFANFSLTLVKAYRNVAALAKLTRVHKSQDFAQEEIELLSQILREQNKGIAILQRDTDLSAYVAADHLDTYYICLEFHNNTMNDLMVSSLTLFNNDSDDASEAVVYKLNKCDFVSDLLDDIRDSFIDKFQSSVSPGFLQDSNLRHFQILARSSLFVPLVNFTNAQDEDVAKISSWIYRHLYLINFFKFLVTDECIIIGFFEFILYLEKVIRDAKGKIKSCESPQRFLTSLGNCFEVSIFNLLRLSNFMMSIKDKMEDATKGQYYYALFSQRCLILILELLKICKKINKNTIYFNRTKLTFKDFLGFDAFENNNLLDIENKIENKIIYFRDLMIETGLVKDLTSAEQDKIANEFAHTLKLQEEADKKLRSVIESANTALKKAHKKVIPKLTIQESSPIQEVGSDEPQLSTIDKMMNEALKEINSSNSGAAQAIYEEAAALALAEKNHISYLKCMHSLAECFSNMGKKALPHNVKNSDDLNKAIDFYEKSTQYAELANNYYKQYAREMRKNCDEVVLAEIEKVAEFITVILESGNQKLSTHRYQRKKFQDALLEKKEFLKRDRARVRKELGELYWKGNKHPKNDFVRIRNEAAMEVDEFNHSIAVSDKKIDRCLLAIEKTETDFIHYIGGEARLKELVGRKMTDDDKKLEGYFLDRIEERAIASGVMKKQIETVELSALKFKV